MKWKIRVTTSESREDSTYSKQTHSPNITDTKTCDSGITEADGIVTDGPAVSINTADCVPLILMTETEALALHISRKNILKNILNNAAQKIPTQKITSIFIGPHICPKHFFFEHEGKEIKEFKKKFPNAWHTSNAGTHLNLKTALQTYFSEWKLDPKIITEDNRCTFESPELVSYRRGDNPKPGIITTVSR